jgi:hypothetical protein
MMGEYRYIVEDRNSSVWPGTPRRSRSAAARPRTQGNRGHLAGNLVTFLEESLATW